MFNFFIRNISESPLWKEQIAKRMALRDINLKVWLETNVFSPVWWLMLVIFIGLWYLWWKLVDKTRLLEIAAFGLMVTVVTCLFDIIAVANVLWGFPNRLTPLSPPVIFEDLCVLPVAFMLVYQYFISWKAYFLAIVVTGLFLAFIVEPTAVWLDIFQLNNWQYSYSLFLYLIMGLFLKWVIVSLKAKQKKATTNKIESNKIR